MRVMTRILYAAAAGLLLAACATPRPYGPASGPGEYGYTVQPIESARYRVGYTAASLEEARNLALYRASEVALEGGWDWFEIVNAYSEREGRSGGGTSVGIGGSTVSGGSSSVGVGVGIGFPIGESRYGKTTHVIEIVAGAGEKPDSPNAYDARSVIASLAPETG